MSVEYLYELRRGDAIVATGRLSTEQPFAVGDATEIAGRRVVVRSIDPIFGSRQWRIVVEVTEHGD